MTTADRHTDLDPAVDDPRRGDDTGHGSRRYDESGQGDGSPEAPPTEDERHVDQPAGAHRLDAQDTDIRGVSDPTLTDVAAAGDTDQARPEGAYASRHRDTHDTSGDSAVRTVDVGGDSPTDGADTTSERDNAQPSAPGTDLERLVPAERVEAFTARWESVKSEFVDEPRQAVASADKLVGELLDELDQLFRKQRSDLEHGLDADEASTEDLRLALRRYRSFFDRLLTL